MATFESLYLNFSDSIIAENSTIAVNTVIEENQKTINEIYFSTISKGIYTFDSAQTAEIYAIAVQCPIAGGKAVPVARGLYRLINDTLVFDDTSDCQEASPRLSKNGETLTNSFIYPNPSSVQASLRYKLPNDIDGWFMVYNIIGNELLRLSISAKNSERIFNCEHFSEGLYIYKILSKGKLVSFGKFSIIR